jgi:hypothetical protein
MTRIAQGEDFAGSLLVIHSRFCGLVENVMAFMGERPDFNCRSELWIPCARPNGSKPLDKPHDEIKRIQLQRDAKGCWLFPESRYSMPSFAPASLNSLRP